MPDLSDPYREALALIDRHGDQATIHAAMEANAMLERADIDGAAHWHRIIATIRGLQQAVAAGTVH